MTPLEKVERALNIARQRLAAQPDFYIYESIVEQLEYMERALLGDDSKSRTKEITIGLYAAREFEMSDPELAQVLHAANAVADRMARGLKP
jgi:hypothetical protein